MQATEKFDNKINDIIDFIKKLTLNEGKLNIILHGGEPLLVKPSSLDYFVGGIYQFNSATNFKIQTNGTLINKEVIDFLKGNNISVGISLDGCNEFQNSCRIFPNGESSFKTVMNKLSLLTASDIKFGLVMSISRLHIGKEREIYDFLSKHKFRCSIRPIFASYNNDNSNVMSPLEYADFFNRLYDIWFDDEMAQVKTHQINEFAKETKKVINNDYRDNLCESSLNCFENFICLDIDGNLYSCNRLYGLNDFYYGNIANISIDQLLFQAHEKLQKRRDYLNDYYKNNDCINFDNGGCPAESFLATKNLLSISNLSLAKKDINEHIKKRVLTI